MPVSSVQVVAFCRQDCIGALDVGQTVAHVSLVQVVASLMEEGFKLCTGGLGVGQTVAHVSRASRGRLMQEGFQLQISHYVQGLAPTPVSLACESCEALGQVCRWSL